MAGKLSATSSGVYKAIRRRTEEETRAVPRTDTITPTNFPDCEAPLAVEGSQLSEIEKSYEIARTLSDRCSYLYTKFPYFGSDLARVGCRALHGPATTHGDENFTAESWESRGGAVEIKIFALCGSVG